MISPCTVSGGTGAPRFSAREYRQPPKWRECVWQRNPATVYVIAQSCDIWATLGELVHILQVQHSYCWVPQLPVKDKYLTSHHLVVFSQFIQHEQKLSDLIVQFSEEDSLKLSILWLHIWGRIAVITVAIPVLSILMSVVWGLLLSVLCPMTERSPITCFSLCSVLIIDIEHPLIHVEVFYHIFIFQVMCQEFCHIIQSILYPTNCKILRFYFCSKAS